jgi:hypothetical protein
LGENVLAAGEQITFFTDNNKLFLAVANKYTKQKPDKFSDTKFRLKSKISKIYKNIPTNVKLIIFLYSLLIIFSTVFYFLNMKLSLIDSLYFVITTTTTVGFGDINLLDETTVSKLFGIFMMVSGAALLAAFFGIIADVLIRQRFEQFLGVSKFKFKNHVIIIGLGSIGYRVANMLHENGIKVVVVESNHECSYVDLLREKIPIIFGDARFGTVLLKAGIKNAQTVAALINDDMKNMNIVLQAKKLSPYVRTVTRIFNQKIENVLENFFEVGSVNSTSSFTMPLFLACSIQKRTITAFSMHNEIYILFETDEQLMQKLKDISEEELENDYGIKEIDKFNCENSRESSHENFIVEKKILFGSYSNIRRLNNL